MFIAIVAVSYFLAINVFGFRIVKIQRADRLKNGDPTPNPKKPKQLAAGNENLKHHPEIEVSQTVKETKETTSAAAKTKKASKSKKTTTKHPHNGDVLEKEDILQEEKLNIKRYERIPDVKILMVAALGGALGEFVSFLIYKYRTTNTLLMVALPVLISVWIYLFYILIGGFFIV